MINTPSTLLRQRSHRAAGTCGFTLIELLMVISVVILLIGLGIGVFKTVAQAQAQARAKGDLIRLKDALNQYKLIHGDYPWIDSTNSEGYYELYASLIGNRSPQGGFSYNPTKRALEARPSGDPLALRNQEPLATHQNLAVGGGEEGSFYELGKGEIEDDAPRSIDQDYEQHFFMDPWGNPYYYAYKVSGAGSTGREWKKKGYILMSYGPDLEPGEGRDIISIRSLGGIIDEEYETVDNAPDNIFSNDL